MATGKFVTYLRVSTSKQGQSGLGLEAQQAAVDSYLNGGDWEVVGRFVEVESGKRSDRPQLQQALRMCRVTGARLLVAKLDRLSRNVAFLANLQESRVKFTACDMPDASELTVHILAAVAQAEVQAISTRTRVALEAAKARGVQLGNPNLNDVRNNDTRAATEARSAKADRFADDITEILQAIRDEKGELSARSLAKELNDRQVPTRRGGQWGASQVLRVLDRQGVK